ncbi:hypothetical protein A3H81_02255 [Candidatus Daviesbacteria bacterium RIFCSPLOWO2_02_FULL_38_18]|nr:MAG: hypothetical protein A3D02_04010 [Candidatus Daviesbacteria bacterium RIFCSPHIGHO2_02_FULL_39_41]OGE68529.1 MAG: hypothetical protein A3H81_02255 [Candidatus Daviesbacteria bacterium RIFCSPLOWO2_02_FULL_38_18]OGE72489.1 MAG: hypothetical protein A3H18_02990 [Candidatus Daviesbacteria bacterium RIFCSPLOWO2_12_FULL_38_10]
MERVVQFDTKRKTSPGFDMLEFHSAERREIRKKASTDAAWLIRQKAEMAAPIVMSEKNNQPKTVKPSCFSDYIRII